MILKFNHCTINKNGKSSIFIDCAVIEFQNHQLITVATLPSGDSDSTYRQEESEDTDTTTCDMDEDNSSSNKDN